jgi:ATP-binding cassette subfamily F protein uup
MEATILAAEDEVARIERMFAADDFYTAHGHEVLDLEKKLDQTRHDIARLYARWEELEAIRAAAS